MGADRRGPLAAFVVIAIIAAVLLVTSVRSQAESGELNRQRWTATGHLGRGGHQEAGLAPVASTRHSGARRRLLRNISRDTARDIPRVRGHFDWPGWFAQLRKDRRAAGVELVSRSGPGSRRP